VCIQYGVYPSISNHYFPSPSCASVATCTFFRSSRTLMSTGTSVARSVVYFPATVTESHYETVPSLQKLILQSLAFVLLIVGVAGVGLVVAGTKRVAFPGDVTRIYEDQRERVTGRSETASVISMPPRCPRCGELLAQRSRAHWACSKCNMALERVGRAWELKAQPRERE
jgi:ribosomal protein S27AE